MKAFIFLLIAPFLLVNCAHETVSESLLNRQPTASQSCQSLQACPWLNSNLSAEERTRQLVGAMSTGQKLQLVFGYFSSPQKGYQPPIQGRPFSAGFIPGLPELGIPSQWQSDAGMGVATQITAHPRGRTALPSGLSTASTWNRKAAYAGGKMIGQESRLSGFNVHLAGGVNLLREPRNGRNFEYAGEDPLLAGVMVGEQIRGIQSNHIISTVKHYAFNNQETNRDTVNALIDEQPARMSDLLALQIAIETGDPGSVMCSYNKVNGHYACENNWLLNEVLKGDWSYKGYVMSDWGATHSAGVAAQSGLDQESGYPLDTHPFFQKPLADAVASGAVTPARLDDMAARILRQMFAKGLFDDPIIEGQEAQIDLQTHARISQADAEEGIVLLKNANSILPLNLTSGQIAIIGGHADVGVLSGGGSSQVYPPGGSPVPNEGPKDFPGPIVYYPSSPLLNLQTIMAARASKVKIVYNNGHNIAAVRDLAQKSDVVIVFATQWTSEDRDVSSLNLPLHQDDLIKAVAQKNAKVIVVLETGGPVLMPWLQSVSGVVEAWYPGTLGGAAIARILTGDANPSGHLAATFPQSEAQLPRALIHETTANYNVEGAAVGYKWFDLRKLTPLFPFGFGLSYTQFKYSELSFSERDRYQVDFKVSNIGARKGRTVPQIYVAPVNAGIDAKNVVKWEAPQRLAAWDQALLEPSVARAISVHIDPRLLAVYDVSEKKWKITEGDYEIRLATSSRDIVARQTVHLQAAEF